MFDTLLEQLCNVEVDQVPLIEKLKQTPRSGKAVRFDKAGLALPKRSVYDHIISLPAQARFFLSVTNSELDQNQLDILFLFHDLAEALIGDAPSFTSQDIAKETYSPPGEKERREEKACKKLLAALPQPLKGYFESYLTFAKDSRVYRFFQMIDKTDPIIAVWRYIALHRATLDIDHYLEAMTDFFLNPEPLRSCTCESAMAIVRYLQNKDCARGSTFFSSQLKSLIEDRAMHYVSSSSIVVN